MNKFLFLDTCAILDLQEKAFENFFYLSSITLNELEGIKTSGTKDEDTKYKARRILHLLEENEDKYGVVIYTANLDPILQHFALPPTNDSKIIASAISLLQTEEDEVIFKTKDLACRALAKVIGLTVDYVDDNFDDYTGFKVIDVSNDELAEFYMNLSTTENKYQLLENQYLLLKLDNEIVAKYKWKDNHYIEIPFQKAESKMFGKITPMRGDPYQQIALDSLHNNQLTVLRGPAGSGKSYLALGYLFSLLEQGKIEKIIIFCNTVATRGAAKLGFYPGSRDEKLLDSQTGNFLVSKFGSITEVERLISEGLLVLMPVSDCRGIDTTGMRAGIYFTEAQNATIDMMKLMLQRIGKDSICVFEGDDRAQVDMAIYGGSNNGLRRLSEIFRGESYYGEVTLVNIHRSKIAERAELM